MGKNRAYLRFKILKQELMLNIVTGTLNSSKNTIQGVPKSMDKMYSLLMYPLLRLVGNPSLALSEAGIVKF